MSSLPPITFLTPVVYIPACLVSDELSATRAALTLTFPQCRHGFHLLQLSGPDQIQTTLEVDFHAGRVRCCVAPDLDMAFDGGPNRDRFRCHFAIKFTQSTILP